MDLSLIVPYHNEKYNLVILLNKVIESFKKIKKDLGFENFELIFIDDGSDDNSTNFLVENLNKIENLEFNLKVVVYRFLENRGQSASLSLGFNNFNGKYVATIDSDLQNDPEDILPLLKILVNNNLDAVSGYRKNRDEGFRVFVSNVGNFIIRIFSGYDIKDVGCSLKVYKDYVVRGLVLPFGYHRFLPIITRAHKNLVNNYPVKHYKRIYGKTHYGYSRIIWLLKNLLMLWILSFYKMDKLKSNWSSIRFYFFFVIFLFTFLPLFFREIWGLSLLFLFLSVVSYSQTRVIVNFYEVFKNYDYVVVYDKEFKKKESKYMLKGGVRYEKTNS
ncbi:MAG: glycosyltransferase family 2 protein [bacterium]